MSPSRPEDSQVAFLRVDQRNAARSAVAALSGGHAGTGMTFSGHGLGSRVAVRPPRNVFWTRVVSFSVWDSEADLDRAQVDSAPTTSGTSWSARLEPLRVWQKGHIVIDPARVATSDDGGPVISVTYSEAIPRQLPSFLRTSYPIEQQVLNADGMLWTMGFFKPPMWFSTVTIWDSAEAVDAFAYSETREGFHRQALPLVHDYFRRSTTMRFRPYAVKGSLSGAPALDAGLLS